MTDISIGYARRRRRAQPRRDIGLKRRYAAERRFRIYGMLAISFGLVFLAIMLLDRSSARATPPSGRRR